MMNNLAWIVLFFAALSVFIGTIGFIFGHGLVNFLACVACSIVLLWALREVSRTRTFGDIDRGD
jgi:hypothetical protein